uniref:Homeobox domain-containing protein n=1 Tax=Panagrolaimus sp. PS1159 TaxID=55785 RepID=A0AC35FH13_9BILA
MKKKILFRAAPNGTTQTRFSTVTEIPKLERWFRMDPHPPRPKLQSYMNILNSTAYRRTNSKVTYQQISNWFTNARAQQRSNYPFTSQQQTSTSTSSSQIPIATAPIDIRTKFNSSNGYNPLLLPTAETDRIDGGSESPNGHDDISEHSISDNDHDILQKESMASSPDQLLYDIAATLNGTTQTPSSPKRATSPSSQQQQQSAATMNALNSMLPNFANLPLTAANQISQFASMFSNSLSNGSTFAQLSKDLINPVTPASSRETGTTHSHSKNEKSTPSSNNNNSENQREGSATSNTPNVARSRLMFDPLSELPILERWFEENPHPGWMQIEQYTDALNALPYRQNYPPISTHNVKIWFKNRRAKCKRLLTNDTSKMGLNQFLQGQLGIKDDSLL